jgi:chromosome-anchoring protein RacA
MNTSEVANLLGVSPSTIQRWVKQLDLPMDRNERGHYHFKNDDIGLLKDIQVRVQNGILLQDIAPLKEKKIRTGVIKTVENNQPVEKLSLKVRELELRLNDKADSVASYQLLQHRQDIEELQSKVKQLNQQIECLQNQLSELINTQQSESVEENHKKKTRKKNFVRTLFGI